MASTRIHPPHVLATLPQPLDHTRRNITARPVYGLRKGEDGVRRPKKRKEVVAGIDGEAISIYDVSTSRLITSYPIPPQESFTCAPCSIRIQLPNKSVARYTFAAMTDSVSRKLTLFKDVVDAAGKTVSTTVHHALPGTADIIHMELLPSSVAGQPGSLVTVCSGGTVALFDVETLGEVWTESSTGLLQNYVAGYTGGARVCSAAATHTVKDSEWLLGVQGSRTASRDGGLTLALVASHVRDGQEKRYILVLEATPSASISGQRLTPLQIAPLPQPSERESGQVSSTYHVDFPSGQLLELLDGRLLVYKLSATIPRLESSVAQLGAQAIIPLSSQTALICASKFVSVYNHVYRWTQAQVPYGASDVTGAGSPKSCSVVGYFGQLDISVVLVDNNLVSIPMEPPQRTSKKRRFDGRLIDAIGRGEARQQNPSEDDVAAGIQSAGSHLAKGDFVKFERVLAAEFQVPIQATTEEAPDAQAQTLQWQWRSHIRDYHPIEKAWITYAVGIALSIDFHDVSGDGDHGSVRLTTTLPSDNIITYLVVSGNLTLSNLRAGLRAQLAGAEVSDSDLSRELVRVIIDIDPTMQLLVTFVAATHLGAPELLIAVKAFMDSLGVPQRQATKLLANEAHDQEAPVNAEDGEVDEMDIDELENELAVAEFHFTEDETNIRGRGLTLALAKLVSCPTATTIHAIRRVFQTDQILSLILVLRQELVSGAWTTRYVEQSFFEEHGVEPPPDGNVSLIANLLSRCLDAVGPKAWFLNDDATFGGHTEAGSFLERLSIDVRAALEGLQEAVYLNGILGEVVRFGNAAAMEHAGTTARQIKARRQNKNHGRQGDIQEMRIETRDANLLPLGAPAAQKVDLVTVDGVGGELKQRSMREIAVLKSKKVGPYTLERLLV